MKFKKDDWEIQVNGGLFHTTHLACGRSAGMVNSEGFTSIRPDDHDEDSVAICPECRIQSPPLRDFEIILESIEE